LDIRRVEGKHEFQTEQFIDDRFYKTALKALASEPGAKS